MYKICVFILFLKEGEEEEESDGLHERTDIKIDKSVGEAFCNGDFLAGEKYTIEREKELLSPASFVFPQ